MEPVLSDKVKKVRSLCFGTINSGPFIFTVQGPSFCRAITAYAIKAEN